MHLRDICVSACLVGFSIFAAGHAAAQLGIAHDISVIPPRALDALDLDPLNVFAGVPVAERMNVGLRVELVATAPGAITEVQWSVPGSVIQGYAITSAVGLGQGYLDECSTTNLSGPELGSPSIAYYYTDTGVSEVTLSAKVEGVPMQASIRFDVRRNPKAEIFYLTGPGVAVPPGDFNDFQTYQQDFGHDVDPAGNIFGIVGEHGMWHATSPSGENDEEFFRFHRGFIGKANCWRGVFGYDCVQVYGPAPNYIPSGDDFDHSGATGDGNGIIDEERHPNLGAISELHDRFTIAGDGAESLADFATGDDLDVIGSDGLVRGTNALINYHDGMHSTLCSFGDFLFTTRTPADPIFWRFHLMLTKVWEEWGFLKLDDGTLSIPTAECGAPVFYPFPEETTMTACMNEPVFSCSLPSGSTLPVGTTTISCMVSDAATLDPNFPGDLGDMMEVMFDVTAEDTAPPDIACPADLTLECDASTDPANTGNPVVADICDVAPATDFSDAEILGSCVGESQLTRTWTATDSSLNEISCDQKIDRVDTTAPEAFCNAPATIVPPDAPIGFTATATDGCDPGVSVEITDFDCFQFTKKGKRIDKTQSCVVQVNGDTITILDSGGVNDRIRWTARATDDCGNFADTLCELVVVNPGKKP